MIKGMLERVHSELSEVSDYMQQKDRLFEEITWAVNRLYYLRGKSSILQEILIKLNKEEEKEELRG